MKVIEDSGSNVNVGRVASQYVLQGESAYVTAKHALIGLIKVAAFKRAPSVHAGALCPYVFVSAMKAHHLRDRRSMSIAGGLRTNTARGKWTRTCLS